VSRPPPLKLRRDRADGPIAPGIFDNADVLPRFLASNLEPTAGVATLSGGEAHHLTRVLRLAAGDTVAVFDGRGREFSARVDRIGGGTVDLVLGEAIEPAAERAIPVTLVQAVLKGASMDDVVRDATMMGVVKIVPLVSAHTVARKATSAHGADRWRRIALASTKQCRRARIPEIADAVSFRALRQNVRDGLTLLLVEPSIQGVMPRSIRSLGSLAPPQSVTLVVGPEGGWSHEEAIDAVGAGFLAVSLGPPTLRADAVALTALAALTVIWD
jgi:16S rRNA (uracil1498-N3)-methyltransferase